MKKAKTERSTSRARAEESIAAGDFSSWLHAFRKTGQPGAPGTDVPCGQCTACCHSSMFIHIRPEETRTLERIPKALLFSAYGLPKGHVLMGYDQKGRCPMFKDGGCSIYEDRPQTCRDYDCRVFAATGIELSDKVHAEISDRIGEWKFDFPTPRDREEFSAVKEAARFLRERGDLFPNGSLPANPSKLAMIAVKVHGLFLKSTAPDHDAEAPSDTEIAKLILDALSK